MFTFCPLQGALSESTASQSLLELDGGVKVLIDVGWDESFEVDKLKELEKYIHPACLGFFFQQKAGIYVKYHADSKIVDKSRPYL